MSKQNDLVTITWRKAFWWTVVLLLGSVMVFTNLIPNGIYFARKEMAQRTTEKADYDDLELIGLREPWTAAIYNDIRIATEHQDKDGKVTYSNGTPISELLAAVGPANVAYQRSNEYDGTKITSLSWENEYNQHLPYWVEITIQYDTVTGFVMEKDIYTSVD